MPIVTQAGPLAPLVLSAAGSVAALAADLRAARAARARTSAEAAEAAVGREYGFLVRAASWLLPMSYVLCAVMSPLLPHRLASVGAGAAAPPAWRRCGWWRASRRC